MRRPLLSVIVPTIGRPTLARALQSIRWQAPAQAVEVLVVGDAHAGTWAADLAPVPALCAQYAARYLAHAGPNHCYGHYQRNYGMTQARGQWLMFSQDDAIWTPAAWAAIAPTLRGPRCPRLFRVETRFGGYVVWNDPPSLAVGSIDADCICTPNRPDRLGRWAPLYEGDAAFIQETVALWRGRVQWHAALIAYSRPDARQDWTWQEAARHVG